MVKPVLVAIHVGYLANMCPEWGGYNGYDVYLTRVRDEMWSQNVMLFLYKRNRVPFELPPHVEVVRDSARGYNTKRLISRLREEKFDKIDVCGEELWWSDAPNLDKNLKRYAEKLAPEKRLQFEEALLRTHVLEPIGFARRLDLNPAEFMKEVFLTGSEVVPGCAKIYFDELSGEFPTAEVNIRRELCYPLVDPE